jgi:hypothetical protein
LGRSGSARKIRTEALRLQPRDFSGESTMTPQEKELISSLMGKLKKAGNEPQDLGAEDVDTGQDLQGDDGFGGDFGGTEDI